MVLLNTLTGKHTLPTLHVQEFARHIFSTLLTSTLHKGQGNIRLIIFVLSVYASAFALLF